MFHHRRGITCFSVSNCSFLNYHQHVQTIYVKHLMYYFGRRIWFGIWRIEPHHSKKQIYHTKSILWKGTKAGDTTNKIEVSQSAFFHSYVFLDRSLSQQKRQVIVQCLMWQHNSHVALQHLCTFPCAVCPRAHMGILY